jgi:hypothetical protein
MQSVCWVFHSRSNSRRERGAKEESKRQRGGNDVEGKNKKIELIQFSAPPGSTSQISNLRSFLPVRLVHVGISFGSIYISTCGAVAPVNELLLTVVPLSTFIDFITFKPYINQAKQNLSICTSFPALENIHWKPLLGKKVD